MLLLLHLICQKLLKTRPRQSRRGDSHWLADILWKRFSFLFLTPESQSIERLGKINAENYLNSSNCVYCQRRAICVRRRTRMHKGLCLLLHLGHFVPAECATLEGHLFIARSSPLRLHHPRRRARSAQWKCLLSAPMRIREEARFTPSVSRGRS